MASLSLKRTSRPKALISLVPMIDVMLILLVFFMVTSTYLNLDMIPAADRSEEPVQPAGSGASGGGTILIRIGADGQPVIRGDVVSGDALHRVLRTEMEARPGTQVLILPSGAARSQALISVMDSATRAGVTRLRVIRLEPRP